MLYTILPLSQGLLLRFITLLGDGLNWVIEASRLGTHEIVPWSPEASLQDLATARGCMLSLSAIRSESKEAADVMDSVTMCILQLSTQRLCFPRAMWLLNKFSWTLKIRAGTVCPNWNQVWTGHPCAWYRRNAGVDCRKMQRKKTS
jgi:hypothetical protein